MDHQLGTLWTEALQIIRKEMNEVNYNTWMKNIYPVSFENGILSIQLPNTFSRNIMEGVHSRTINEAVNKVVGSPCELIFLDPATNHLPPISKPAVVNENRKENLISRYTFENFVVGKNNHLAYAAAMAVAKNPSEDYNPLFIYGGVGLGKTHLMHAIGHYIHDHDPDSKVLYVTFEQFLNQLINSIQRGENEKFRETFRNVDVLMVDDIHFISGKEQTQEEFFHTFNALYFSNKQIIISSDRPPREIQTLEERLRSRFESGLIVDISAPDLETRMAILRKKADMESVNVPDEAINYIATHVKSNIRELEGSLIRVVAFAVLTNQPVTQELVKQALDSIIVEERKLINAPLIMEKVSDYYNISVKELLGRKRTKNIAFPRQVAMFLTRELTDLSLPKIGQEFGGRDHTTILHAYDKINDMQEVDEDLAATIKYIKENIQQ
ncbi:MAG: chromosomal replication initiator protein DnaA [Tissierellia bacterium]|nr:chromosomal replication initiator protein DnaA [Tissierellia bacterium]